MCNNDAIALGVLASLKNVGYGIAEKPFPVITGMDCDIANIKAIKSGEISMTVFKDNRIIAEKAAEVMALTMPSSCSPLLMTYCKSRIF